MLVGFLIAAFAFALTVSRSLQAQIERLLRGRARARPRGDFAVEVPTEGNDEFAALGTEFNSMARELQARLEELQLERQRLREAIRRVGQSFAKGLDRDARARDRRPDRGRRRRRELSAARRVRTGPRGPLRARSPARATSSATATRSTPPRPPRSTPSEVVRDRGRRPLRALARRCAPTEGGAHPRHAHRRRASGRLSAGERELFTYLAQQAGRLDRERRPARDGPAPGGHRRAHRPVQPPALPGGHRPVEVERAKRFEQRRWA